MDHHILDDPRTRNGQQTLSGDEAPPATQTFSVEVKNESSKEGALELAMLDAGSTFADVEAYVEAEQQRLADGLEIVGRPASLTLMARAVVATGETGALVATGGSGEYALWCAHEHPPTAVSLA